MIDYFNQFSFQFGIGFIIGIFTMWCIWRFFFNFVYQDDNTDEKIEQLEKKIDNISKHIGVQNRNENEKD
jgi:uncharacterized membrane-anchored protein YhcB (DUF1043 family)